MLNFFFSFFLADEKELPGLCTLPMVVGKCRATLPRYYFDTKENQCKMFLYGGCGGNKNNFLDMQQCAYTCQPHK
ncbi:PI-actitoxin-Aeq3a-like [Macrotis lagotis]|uniref:PI-actitoxin-Aeq3a-like n=1 Tax=Macrotis lagotis TaxID=92651 RepID=UPI003D6805E1